MSQIPSNQPMNNVKNYKFYPKKIIKLQNFSLLENKRLKPKSLLYPLSFIQFSIFLIRHSKKFETQKRVKAVMYVCIGLFGK